MTLRQPTPNTVQPGGAVRRTTSLMWIARPMWILGFLAAAIAANGCRRPPTINSEYGQRRGSAAGSVNGVAVLGKMFQSAGHRVVSRGRDAPRIDDCQVIVWAPDRFAPPTADEREVIERWLSESPGRTFVYIGRDYDAAVDYWRRAAEMASGSAPSQDVEDVAARRAEYQRRLAEARSQFETRRSEIPEEENVDWFVDRRDFPAGRVRRLAGDWSADIDAAKASIWIRSRFDVPSEQEKADAAEAADDLPLQPEWLVDEEFLDTLAYDATDYGHEVLLAAAPQEPAVDGPFAGPPAAISAEGAPLVTRVTHPAWEDGAVVVVTNGSFLLNLPLVNHEHRKLAGHLIDECGNAPAKVAFWRGDNFAPASASQINDWSVLTTWPLNFILLHLAVLGIVYVLWRFPIFGPAKDIPPAATSDFAKHIDALGELMAGACDAGYARAKLQAYRTGVRGETREPPASEFARTSIPASSLGSPAEGSESADSEV